VGQQKETKLSQDLAAAMPPGQFRMILKKKKIQPEVASVKPQATSNKRLKQQALDKPGL
jgi:hypothetical protein